MRTIAIVGAGFSGTATAIHLLNDLNRGSVRVVLIDVRDDVGAGVAYETRDYPYLLNVPAGQMSVDAARPKDFFDYARAQGVSCTEADFLPRALYGEYLRERLRAAVERAPAGVHCTHIRGRVVRIVRTEDHARWQLVFEDGREMLSDQVVLALGNPPPARLSALRAILPTQHYIHNPWDDSARSWSAPRVLLVGTSLTMADVAMRLFHDRTPPQKIVCLSRHGYLPLEQTSFDRSATGPDAIAEIEAAGCSLRRVVHAVHALGEEAAARGADWRELVTIVRKRIPRLWGRLSDEDRRRFLRHVRPIWDKHRHRLPCETLGQIEHMRSAGILDVRAGSLVDARVAGEEVEVCWRPRGTSQVRSESFDRVINCTGPDYDAVRSDDPLVSCLLESGLISADRLSLGVRINERYEVIGAGGRPIRGMHYIGPWLRAQHWEATAVPELRIHAARLATLIARSERQRRRADVRASAYPHASSHTQ